MNEKNIVTFSSTLFYIIPLALLTGSFIPDFLISSISVIFLSVSLHKRYAKYFLNTFFYVFIGLYLYLLIISFFSEIITFSLKSTFFYFRFIIFSLAVWYLIEHNKNFINTFFYFFLFAFSLAIVDGYVQFFFDAGIFGIEASKTDRLSLTFNDRMILGGYLSRLFPLLVALFIFKLDKKENNHLALMGSLSILIILTDILIYISGERTAMGLMMITTIMIIVLISKFRLFRVFSILISLFIIITLTFTSSQIKNRNIDHTLEQLGFISETNNKQINYLSTQHESHIKSAWKMFLNSPLIGSGPNMFRIHCKEREYFIDGQECSTHPHNNHIQLLSETGALGFLFIVIITVYLAKCIISHLISMIKNSKHKLSNYQICLLICFSLTVFPFLPTMNFYNNWINVIYYLPVGFYLQSIYFK